jgi:hypothetical protein
VLIPSPAPIITKARKDTINIFDSPKIIVPKAYKTTELSKIIPNSAGPIEFKIPTQVGTHLKALSLVDHLGKPVPKSASKILFFADGTVGFRIDGNASSTEQSNCRF